ncbi:preprotein translocase subunit YajC [Nocardia sp. NPDC051750]|uniref:preprotein translocase subunit YajC n=1 Tax=Nocardia sp. NPDC051750 TaxID=3364325 RepID=UPI0037ACDBC3
MESLLFPLLLAGLLAFMFLGMRRQKKEADKVTQMQNNLKIGDQVVTTSGLYGTVVEVDDTTVDLEIAEEVVTTWLRLAIREVRADAEVADESTGDDVTVESADAPAGDETAAPAAEETPEQTATRLTKD